MQLLTLGGLRLDAGDFTRPKPLLLLCYLTIEGSQSRRVLADLFFADTKDPRDSLSTAYRQLCSIDADVIVADGDRLASAIANDATKLIEALDAGLLEPAIDLYEGAFLDGLDLELAEELEEWVFTTREYLAGRVREAHLSVGEALAAEQDLHGASRHAEAAWDLGESSTWQPEAFPRLYRLLKSGRSPAAGHVTTAAAEFGIQLDDLSFSAVEAPVHGSSPNVRPNNLPPPRTSFVGRDAERLEIASLLHTSHGRVLTIHGPGGIGKSRLALRAARDQLHERSFVDGIYVVALESVAEESLIPNAIASTLDEDLSHPTENESALSDLIGDRRMLLILDGFEHLADGADFVPNLVAACPHLRVIVTSRVRLNIDEEHVLPLRGLPLPKKGITAEEALHADSLQLVLQRGKKARLDFELTPEEVPDAIRICEKLEGSPLAIEMAMAWTRLMSVRAIRAEIERDIEFLESHARNVSGSHSSFRAVFERSWSLLHPRDQEVLPKLTVFRGGFRREAAADVAEATLPVLIRLVDASLLSVSADGRYELHALIQEFCLERLQRNPAIERDALDRHQKYFRAYATQLLEFMYTSNEVQALEAVTADLPNILHAWTNILDRDAEPEKDFPTPLVVYFDRTARFGEGQAFYRHAVHALRPHLDRVGQLFPEVLAGLAWLEYRSGALSTSEDSARETIGLADPNSAAAMIAANLVGLILSDTDRYDEADAWFEQAIAVAETRGEPRRAGLYLMNRGKNRLLCGDAHASRIHLERAMQIGHDTDYPFLLVLAWNNYAVSLEYEGDFAGAREWYRKTIALAQELGDERQVSWTLISVAESFIEEGRAGDAAAHLEKAAEVGNPYRTSADDAMSLNVLGRIHASEGRYSEAVETLESALEAARLHPRDGRWSKIATTLARVHVQAGSWDDANRWLGQIEIQHVLPPHVRRELDELKDDVARAYAQERSGA